MSETGLILSADGGVTFGMCTAMTSFHRGGTPSSVTYEFMTLQADSLNSNANFFRMRLSRSSSPGLVRRLLCLGYERASSRPVIYWWCEGVEKPGRKLEGVQCRALDLMSRWRQRDH